MTDTVGEAAFKEAYASLNAAQKQAVDTIDGPVMVVAGPGTGKTQILTLRIANILLQTDTQPENILALTFTESGAKAMRERLVRYIGAAAYRVSIHTFHGFAGRLINDYPDAFPAIVGGRPASDIDKINLITEILDSGDYVLLRPHGNPTYYVTPIIRIIGTLKQEYLTPERFGDVVTRQEEVLANTEQYHEKGAHKGKVRGEYTKLEKTINKNRELLAVYKAYEVLLREERLFDFEDMLMRAVTALREDEDMLRDLQETYQYVLADEHQDVNGTQNELLELLVSYHDNPNIFAVGDEKQAIYRFQGASLENFLYFEEKFPGTTTIALTENYRSGQSILDGAHSLVAVEDGPLTELRVPLTAAAVSKASVTHRDFSHQAVEDAWLVDAIQTAVQEGVDPAAIAVIVRTNREVEQLSGLLRRAGLAVTASADGDILRHPITQSVLNLIDAVVSPEQGDALFTVLHAPYWQIATDDLVRTLSLQSYKTPLAMLIGDTKTLEGSGVEAASIMHVHKTLETARTQMTTEAPQRVLEQLLVASGFIDHVLTTDPVEGARVVRRLYDEVEELVLRDRVQSLAAVAAALRTREAYGLPLNAPYIANSRDAVQVMTAHKSKGLEFDTVFMPHLTDNVWGGSVRRNLFTIPLTKHLSADDFDALDDERRLLFVGMTRAETTLHMSCSGTNAEGKELLPSRLLADIDSNSYTTAPTDMSETQFDPLASLQGMSEVVAIDISLLTSLVEERGFSATSINNYLRSPWDYVYRNLLRIPQTQPVHMQYGTVVHNVLERFTAAHTAGTKTSSTDIKHWIDSELGKLPITEEEYTRLHERAFTALTQYSEHLSTTLPKTTKEELSISVSLSTGLDAIPEIRLTGKLDRIDMGEDGRAMRVVDYKTGKPKTRNAIEGKTQSDDGGYKRQLVFYALLLELYDDERYQTREGVLSFVESDSKGNIREESFNITNEEIRALKQEIIDAVSVLTSGSFLTEPASEEDTEYWQLVTMLKQE